MLRTVPIAARVSGFQLRAAGGQSGKLAMSSHRISTRHARKLHELVSLGFEGFVFGLTRLRCADIHAGSQNPPAMQGLLTCLIRC